MYFSHVLSRVYMYFFPNIQCLTFFCFAAKLVPIGYGIKKLQINCVIEDDKISTDFLEEEITGIEDLVSLKYCVQLFKLILQVSLNCHE